MLVLTETVGGGRCKVVGGVAGSGLGQEEAWRGEQGEEGGPMCGETPTMSRSINSCGDKLARSTDLLFLKSFINTSNFPDQEEKPIQVSHSDSVSVER